MEIPLMFPNHEGIDTMTLLITPSGWIEVPIVLLCRGDASREADGQDRQIAGFLESEGIASLLLDFSTRVPPAGELTRGTLKALIADVSKAMDVLLLQRGVNPDRIALYGTGVAGAVGMYLATTDPRLRSLVLASTPVPSPSNGTTISIPTLFIAGGDDQATRDGIPRLENWMRGPYELRIIPRADRHLAQTTAFSRLARDTVSWFVRYLGTGYQAMRA